MSIKFYMCNTLYKILNTKYSVLGTKYYEQFRYLRLDK